MDDGVQRGERGIIAHHLGAQRGAIQAAVGGQHVAAEPAGNRGEHGASGRLRFAREGVGVDDRGAPFFEALDDGRLAGGDVAGEGDV